MSDPERLEVRRFPDAVTMIREADHREDVQAYVVEGSREVAVIDTGLGDGDFHGVVERLTSLPPRVLQTHLHWDHVGASRRFSNVLAHPEEIANRQTIWPWEPNADATGEDAAIRYSGVSPTGGLAHGDRIDLGGRVLEALHTPGHSPGSLCFFDREARALFTGDLLYLGMMLLFVPGSDLAAFQRSLDLIVAYLDDIAFIYPAHGPAPLRPSDAVAIRDGFETVMAGTARMQLGTYNHFQVAIFNFERFAFLLPPRVLDDCRRRETEPR